MQKIRVHKSIDFMTKVTVSGESVNLEGRVLQVELKSPNNQKYVIVPEVENDTLKFSFKPTVVGTYGISIYLDRYTKNETMADKCNAFQVVSCTEQESDYIEGNMDYEYISLDADIACGIPGPKGGRGPIGPQGNPATINGYETLTVTQAAPITIAQVDGTLTIGLDPDKSVTPEDLNEEIQNRIKGDNDVKNYVDDQYYNKRIMDATWGEYDQKIEDIETEATRIDQKLNNTDTIAKQAKAIAEGKSTAMVFDTVEDMNVYILAHGSTLKVGDIFYIKATDVPDYWWTGTEVSPLETEKPDLSNFYNKTEIDGKLGSKQDTLTPGDNITIEDGVISSTGGFGAGAIIENADLNTIRINDGYYKLGQNVENVPEGLTAAKFLTQQTDAEKRIGIQHLHSENGKYLFRIFANFTDTVYYFNWSNVTPDMSEYPTWTELNDELLTKQDTLTPGTGITIENNVISSTGGGGGSAIWTGTESEYNDLETINPEMIYIVESD